MRMITSSKTPSNDYYTSWASRRCLWPVDGRSSTLRNQVRSQEAHVRLSKSHVYYVNLRPWCYLGTPSTPGADMALTSVSEADCPRKSLRRVDHSDLLLSPISVAASKPLTRKH
jgi:hypothetical protein